MRNLLFLSVLIILSPLGYYVVAQEPDDVPTSDENKIIKDEREYAKLTPVWIGQARHIWYLKFEYEKPRQIVVGQEFGRTEIYWYMLYKITNIDSWAHEVFLEINAWSDKGVEYQDFYAFDVIDAIEKKENKEEANGGKGLYHTGKVSMPREIPERLTKHPKHGVHADDTGLNIPRLEPGESWECVAVFKRVFEPQKDRFRINVKGLKSWDPEANFIRIRIAGLSNDFRIITHEDTNEIPKYLGKDCLILEDGSELWGRVSETREEYQIITEDEAGNRVEKTILKSRVYKWIKSEKSALLPNERLIVEPFFEILYRRKGDEFASTEDPIEFVEDGWVRHWRILKADQDFYNDFKEFREAP